MLSMLGMPMFGLLADRIGKRALLMTIGSALLVPPFLMLPYWSSGVILPRIGLPFIGTILSAGAPLDAVVAMAMLGLSFALVPAVLWPAVTYLVPDARLGSAYALMTFCQQIGWAGMSWGIGAANDAAGASAQHPAGWLPAMWMLAALATAGFVFSFLLWREERGPSAHGLEASTGRHAA